MLAAYAHGVVSSRGIARLCQEHVTFIALCGDQPPHFTTIADFVSTLGDDIARMFAAVVAICDRQGLIGREMFAIDGGIRWNKRWVCVSHLLMEQHVGLEAIDDGLWNVYFGPI